MTPLEGRGLVKPLGNVVLSVLYLFAGRPRRADIGACLSAITAEFNKCVDFAFNITLQVVEVDIVRGGMTHDLLSAARRKDRLGDIREGRHAALILAPPCETHTRARHANRDGPPPLRSLD